MHVEVNLELANRGDMVLTEAKATCESIRGAFDRIKGMAVEIRGELLALHDRKGWVVLGYETWKACVEAEFSISYRAVDLELQAARIEREIEQADSDGSRKNFYSHEEPVICQEKLPSNQLRALKDVEPAQMREVIEEAKATAPKGKMTEKHLKETANRKAGKTKPEPAAEQPEPAGKSKVNGQVVADPPDVAKARAAGKIAADVVVEVTEPEQPECPEPEPSDPADSEVSDEDWLAELPAYAILDGVAKKTFEAEAMAYRRLEKARKTFQHHATRVLNAMKRRGPYARRVTRFLKTDHPRHWLVCPAEDDGGCGGTGQLPVMSGQCPKCYGKGYWIK